MKKNLLVFTALTFSSTANFLVQAQPSPGALPSSGPNGNNGQRQEHKEKMLQMFDTNHDGTLDDNERAQMRQAMQNRRMQGQSEGNGVGGGSTYQPPGFEQRMLQKFDNNHDGQLDDGERAQMQEFMQRRRMRRQQSGGFNSPPGGLPPSGNPGSNNK